MLLLFSVGLLRSKTMCFQYRELNFMSDYRGCFLHESVGKWHFGQIRKDAGLFRCRIRRFDCIWIINIKKFVFPHFILSRCKPINCLEPNCPYTVAIPIDNHSQFSYMTCFVTFYPDTIGFLYDAIHFKKCTGEFTP